MLISNITRFFNTLLRVYSVCKLKDSLKFTIFAINNAKKILKQKNLGEIYKKMGQGPFKIKSDKKIVTVIGHKDDLNGTFSGLMEIFINKVYNSKHLDFTKFKTVLDLGAGSGNFTNFALTKNHDLKIILVEPRGVVHPVIEEMIIKNNYKRENIKIFDFYLGDMESIEKNFQKYSSNKIIENGESFIKKFNLKKVDLIKCDIEGSEHSFFKDGFLLKITDNIAIEIHNLEYLENFIELLKKFGFEVKKMLIQKKEATVIAKKMVNIGCGGRI